MCRTPKIKGEDCPRSNLCWGSTCDHRGCCGASSSHRNNEQTGRLAAAELKRIVCFLSFAEGCLLCSQTVPASSCVGQGGGRIHSHPPDLLLQGRRYLVKLGSSSSPGSRAPEQFHLSNAPLFFTLLISSCLFTLTSEMLNCEIFPTRQGLSKVSRCQWASFISEFGNPTCSGERV